MGSLRTRDRQDLIAGAVAVPALAGLILLIPHPITARLAAAGVLLLVILAAVAAVVSKRPRISLGLMAGIGSVVLLIGLQAPVVRWLAARAH